MADSGTNAPRSFTDVAISHAVELDSLRAELALKLELADANSDSIRLNNEKMNYFERILKLEADLAGVTRERDEAVTKLAGRESYRAKNPMGGPARVFDAMADRIRAGEEYDFVLDDYRFCSSSKLEAAERERDEAVRDFKALDELFRLNPSAAYSRAEAAERACDALRKERDRIIKFANAERIEAEELERECEVLRNLLSQSRGYVVSHTMDEEGELTAAIDAALAGSKPHG